MSAFNACPVIDNEFRHNSCFDNVMTKFMINNRTDAWKTDVNLFIIIKLAQFASWRH